MRKPFVYVLPALCLGTTSAFAAAAGGGGGLPWDAPLTTIQTDLSGPTAGTLALIGFVMVFAVLIFGGELNFFGRTLAYTVMAASVLVAGVGLLGALGIAGATVGNETRFHLSEFVAGLAIAYLSVALALWLRKVRQQRLRWGWLKLHWAKNQIS